MLDFELVPEKGLSADQWEFVLGMHFSQAIALTQSLVRHVKAAHVVYNEQNPLSNDLILDLPHDGFRLMFDSGSQRLKLIEIYNLRLIRLKYCGNVFNGPDMSPSVDQIDRTFGATRPGSYDKQRQLFALNFRGLTFTFPVDLQYQPHYSHGLGSLRFPGDSAPVLSKILIYTGVNPADPGVPPFPISCFKGHVYAEDCHVIRNEAGTRTLGLGLRLFTPSNSVVDETINYFEREIMFGEKAESVVAKLGTPSRVFYKSDDKMKIHSKEAHKKVTSVSSDYFFNYFTLGLDILFDSCHHKATKFMLHTNFPGHYDFNSYHRSAFSLRVGRSPSLSQQPTTTTLVSSTDRLTNLSSPAPPPNNNNNNGGNGKNGKNSNPTQKSPKMKKTKQNNGNNSQPEPPPMPLSTNVENVKTEKNWISVNYKSHWEEVSEFTGGFPGSQDRVERPVVLTRSSSNNPFGSSLCYGVQDMIFEVMSNDHIASITLYQQDPN